MKKSGQIAAKGSKSHSHPKPIRKPQTKPSTPVDDEVELLSDQGDHDDDHDESDILELRQLQDVLSSLEYARDTLLATNNKARSAAAEALNSQIEALEVEIAEVGCDLDSKDYSHEAPELPEIPDDESVWEIGDSDESIDLLSDAEEDDNEEVSADVKHAVTASPAAATTADSHTSLLASSKEFAAKAKPAATVSTPIVPTKFAPHQPTLKGTYDICCIGIVWANYAGPSTGQLSSMGNQVKKTYDKLSGGVLILNPAVMKYKTKFNRSTANLNKVEQAAKSSANAKRKAQGKKPFDQFLIVNSNAKKYSNAGRDTAHLQNCLIRTALHEDGHLWGLGHAGKYANNGAGKLDPYGDRFSFMGRFPSIVLNAPQEYSRGWYDKTEIAQYDKGDPATEYDMVTPYVAQSGSTVKGVLIPGGGSGRNLMFSSFTRDGQAYLSVYYLTGYGSGTQQGPVFNKSATYAGLTFERVSTSGNVARVKISPA